MREALEVGSVDGDPLFGMLASEGALDDAVEYARNMTAYVINHNLEAEIENGANDYEARVFAQEDDESKEPQRTAGRTFRRRMEAHFHIHKEK